jgi:hypothetical protein
MRAALTMPAVRNTADLMGRIGLLKFDAMSVAI